MGEKLVIGPINKGLKTDREPFNIDNDSFPVLINAYQWRGRVKRKRGTSLLNRLKRFFNSSSLSYNSGSATIVLDGSGVGNLLIGFSLQANGNIVPGTVTITAPGPTVFTDPSMDGSLSPSGTINYATGVITILAEAGQAVSAVFNYYPDLPVMGLEDFISASTQFPGTLGFDTTYSYNITTAFPYNIYDVSFYKNPPANGTTLPGYVQKLIVTPTSWNGLDYQQFWTVNYQGALWATNGITVPFTTTNIGMQFKAITGAAGALGPPAFVILTIPGHGLVAGDFIFINEIQGMTGINFQTGYVVVIIDPNTVIVELPNAVIGGVYVSGGIAQYLTNRADPTLDGIRWYDGDPTNGNATNPVLSGNLGWVNFAPPLSQLSYSIADLPPAQYYLVGARMIVPFKDRLLFLGPVIQTSSANSQIYLQDSIIYSQNGTPYYTASYTNSPNAAIDTPTSAANIFHPILVPINQTATSTAYFEDQSGFGGFITAGIDQPITTVSANEDVLIVGFATLQSRLIYSGNDLVPFNFFVINSELGSASTFSAINMDKGVLTRGSRGFIITAQVGAERFDLDIPDSVFQINLVQNGNERFCAQRDFISEWVYFTYRSNSAISKFPSQTLLYNYRDNSWATFNESYTTYGSFRRVTGFTWATVGNTYPTWSVWNAPWNAGASTLLQQDVIAGNQQGFVIFRDNGTTTEANSLYIQSISGSTVISPSHGLNRGDYIVISGALGTIGSLINGKIFSVNGTPTEDSFILNPSIGSGTYLGGGLIKRMYVPFVQTKQFPMAWGLGRKTRIGVQQYLLTTTAKSQITLLIYLSQDANNAYNNGPIIPASGSENYGLIYSQVLFTCPESSNLGLTPANTNLQMISLINSTGTNATSPQSQIWHRVNTSLIGDTVQLAFTLSDAQMRQESFINQFDEIELHGAILDLTPSQMLS
jgi:hypothetical protein